MIQPEITANHAWSGSRYINVMDPLPEDMDLREIAVGLSRESRYGGACTRIFWSVAQHTLLCDHLAEEDGVHDLAIRRAILFHDAPEYMLRDLIRPVKRNCPSYIVLEQAWWRAMSERFDLPRTLPPVVKFYDDLALAVEKRSLIASDSGRWPGITEQPARDMPQWLLDLSMEEAAKALFVRMSKDAPATWGEERIV